MKFDELDEKTRNRILANNPDIAEEVALLTRNQILVQASTAMVGQDNLIQQLLVQTLKKH